VGAAEIARTDSYAPEDPDSEVLRFGTDDDYADEEIENAEDVDNVVNADADGEDNDDDDYEEDEFELAKEETKDQAKQQKMSLESD